MWVTEGTQQAHIIWLVGLGERRSETRCNTGSESGITMWVGDSLAGVAVGIDATGTPKGCHGADGCLAVASSNDADIGFCIVKF